MNRSIVVGILFLFNIHLKAIEPSVDYSSNLPKASTFITGWYGQVQLDATTIKNKGVYVNSFGLGFTLSNNVNIGLEGALFTDYNGLYFENVSKGEGAYLKGGYVGLGIEPTIQIINKLDVAFPILFAIGNARFSSAKGLLSGSPIGQTSAETFLMIAPGSELQWALVQKVKLCFGVSYRHTSGLSIGDLPYDILDGLNTSISLRFVSF